jgi:hypothetical protein
MNSRDTSKDNIRQELNRTTVTYITDIQGSTTAVWAPSPQKDAINDDKFKELRSMKKQALPSLAPIIENPKYCQCSKFESS